MCYHKVSLVCYVMKKISTFLSLLAIGSSIALSQTLLSTSFQTQEEFEAWTVVDNNSDGYTWKFDVEATPSKVFYSYNGSNGADDWLFSPAITPTVDGTIAVAYKVYGSSYTEKMEVKYGASATIEGMANVGVEMTEYLDQEYGNVFLVDGKAGETLYLGFHAVSDADKWRLYLIDVDVKLVANPIDLSVDELVSPVSGNGLSQETVTVKITNKGRVAAESFKIFYSVNDGEAVEETVSTPLEVGASIDYTFATKADLSAPRTAHTVKVWVESADDINSANNTITASVMHKAPAAVPYYMGFEANEYTDEILLLNLNEDDGDWTVHTDPWWNTARTGYYSLAYNYDRNNSGDDWAILDPISITEAGYYVLKFWYSTDDSYAESFKVCYGSEQSVEAMTNTIVDLNKVANSEYKESITIIYLDQPQQLCLGFYSYTDKDQNWISIDDVSFEKVSADNVDLALTEIINPVPYIRAQSSKDVSFTIRSLGIKGTNAKVTVSVDGQQVSESEIAVAAQETKTISIADLLASLAEGEHTISVTVESADDENAENNALSATFRVVGEAAYYWDFEDGKIPENFSFRIDDEGTVNPSAGSEYNEYGWGLYTIQTHQQFGEYVFAGCSWLDGVEEADRWCILPHLKITSENAYLLWDAASFNATFLEDYRVKVSDSEDVSWYYYTEADILAESPTFKTRGVDLSEYSGKEVYIAFQLVSKNCESLVMDNIGLYGSFEVSGIEDVISDEDSNRIMQLQGKIVVSGDVDSLSIVDLSGRRVAETAESELSTDSLLPGIYVVVAKTPTATITQKIAVK